MEVHPRALQSILDEVRDRPEETVISTVMLRSMKQAKYVSGFPFDDITECRDELQKLLQFFGVRLFVNPVNKTSSSESAQ
jgi:hypothetical protein